MYCCIVLILLFCHCFELKDDMSGVGVERNVDYVKKIKCDSDFMEIYMVDNLKRFTVDCIYNKNW